MLSVRVMGRLGLGLVPTPLCEEVCRLCLADFERMLARGNRHHKRTVSRAPPTFLVTKPSFQLVFSTPCSHSDHILAVFPCTKLQNMETVYDDEEEEDGEEEEEGEEMDADAQQQQQPREVVEIVDSDDDDVIVLE